MSQSSFPSFPSHAPESMLRMLADNVPAMIAYYDLSPRCVFANKLYAEVHGWDVESIIGKTAREVVGEASWPRIEPHVELSLKSQRVKYNRPMTLPNGEQCYIEVNLIPHFDQHGEQIGGLVLMYDITRQEQMKLALRDSEERLRKFVSTTNEGVYFYKDGIITDINEALLKMLGYTRTEIIGHRPLEFVAPEWQQAVSNYVRVGREDPYEFEMLHKNGQRVAVEAVGKTTSLNNEIYRFGVLRDITAHKQTEAQILYLAHHDALTGLPNRVQLIERLTGILALAKRRAAQAAILFVDLDNLKLVNDSLGHHAGDLLLQQVAIRIKEVLREADMVSRLGGDEFLVVLTDIQNVDDVANIANKLLQRISGPMQIKDRQLSVSASIGISLFPQDADNADELISLADTAMYIAKEAGRGHTRFYPSQSAVAPE